MVTGRRSAPKRVPLSPFGTFRVSLLRKGHLNPRVAFLTLATTPAPAAAPASRAAGSAMVFGYGARARPPSRLSWRVSSRMAGLTTSRPTGHPTRRRRCKRNMGREGSGCAEVQCRKKLEWKMEGWVWVLRNAGGLSKAARS